MKIAFDIETYIKYDGTEEVREEIYRCSHDDTREKYERDGLEKGCYYPVLNARKFVCGAIAFESKSTEFYTNKNEMVKRIIELAKSEKKRGKRLFVYGHNVSYDYYGSFDKFFFNKDMKYICFRPFIANYDENLFFVDTVGIFRKKLSDIGDELGYEKLKMPEKIRFAGELKDYVCRDAEICLKAVKVLKDNLESLGMGIRKIMTAGQVNMSMFLSWNRRKKSSWYFMEKGKIIKSDYMPLERVALRGGRCEAFQTGEWDKTTLIDLNSLYPFVMTKMEFPNLRSEIVMREPFERLGMEMFNFVGIAKMRLKVPEGILPYLPVRYRAKGGSIKEHFVGSGVIESVWTLLELKKAIELGYKVIDSSYAIMYQKHFQNPFKGFMEELYKLRLDAPESLKGTIKLMMNNLHGKFGQRVGGKDLELIGPEDLNKYAKTHEYKGCFGNLYAFAEKNEDYVPVHGRPLIGALTSAMARDELYDGLVKIPRDDLIYCDTDGILFIGNHLKKFNFSWDMGAWKVVSNSKPCIVKGEKRYLPEEGVKLSGVRKDDLTREDFLRGKVKSLNMISLLGALKRGDVGLAGTFEWKEDVISEISKKDEDLPYEVVEDVRRQEAKVFKTRKV